MIKARGLALLAGLWLAVPAAQSQSLQDPTRPPAAAAGGDAALLGAEPQLQSVLVSRQAGGRLVAVIDGETVRQGDSFRGARVAHIGQDGVVLLRGRERQVLKLPSDTLDDGKYLGRR